MRIRLTLEITRSRKPEPPEEPHETFESQGSLVEQSGPAPLGFQIPAPRSPFEERA
jgi:hypothetical protein